MISIGTVGKQLLYSLCILLVTYNVHEVMERMYFNHCRSNLINVYFYSTGKYCSIVNNGLSFLESSFVDLMKIDFLIKSVYDVVVTQIWPPSFLNILVEN
jgi:hypothetical protein